MIEVFGLIATLIMNLREAAAKVENRVGEMVFAPRRLAYCSHALAASLEASVAYDDLAPSPATHVL